MEVKETIVYSYKGVVGVKSAENCAGLVNDPNDRNGMMYLVNTDNIKFSGEAIELLKKIPASTDSVGDVMTYKVNDLILFGFKGGPIKIIGRARPKSKKEADVFVAIYGDVNFQPELLVATEGIKPDKSFMAYVDKLENEGKLEQISIQ